MKCRLIACVDGDTNDSQSHTRIWNNKQWNSIAFMFITLLARIIQGCVLFFCQLSTARMFGIVLLACLLDCL